MEITDVPIKLIDPHPQEPQARMNDVAELAESIKEIGVQQAVTLLKSGKRFITIMGHRRIAAAGIAGLKTVPAVVVETWDEAGQLKALLAENTTAKPFTGAEEAGLMQTVLQLGVEAETLARTIGRDEKLVSTAWKGLKLLTDAEAAESTWHAVSLEELTVIAGFDDDPKAVKKLAKVAGTGSFGYVSQDLITARKRKEAKTATKAQLTDQGIRVIKTPNYMPGSAKSLAALSINPGEHMSCPGHCAWIDYDGTSYSLGCDQPELHSASAKADVERKAKREQEERDAQARKAAWEAASTVRRAWIKTNLAVFAAKSEARTAVADRAWTRGLQSGDIDERSQLCDEAKLTAEMKLFVLYAMVFEFGYHTGLDRVWEAPGYCSTRVVVESHITRVNYLEVLISLGYQLTEPESVYHSNVCQLVERERLENEAEAKAKTEECTTCYFGPEKCDTEKDPAECWEWNSELADPSDEAIAEQTPLMDGAVAEEDESDG
jgi:ParB family chromosome partitioning protein